MGMKKTYGIFTEVAEKVDKLLKRKVERVLVDTLYEGPLQTGQGIRDLS